MKNTVMKLLALVLAMGLITSLAGCGQFQEDLGGLVDSLQGLTGTKDPSQATEPTGGPDSTQPSASRPSGKPPVFGTAEKLGLQTLQGKANGQTLVVAYEKIAAGVEAGQETISLEDAQYPLSTNDLELVYLCYRNDYPQHFFLNRQYSWDYTEDVVLALKVTYTMTGDALVTARADFEAAVQSILSLLYDGMSTYEMELAIHDALIDRCSYISGPNAHCAYGALVEGQAVCEGYAEAFQYLLHRAGISCMVVSGDAGGPHVWNAVKLEDGWYYTDVTWDDPVLPEGEAQGPVRYGYFNLTKEMMEQDHAPSGNVMELPAADKLTYNYHQVNGSLAEQFVLADMTAWLKASDQVRVYVTGDLEAYIDAFKADLNQLLWDADKLECTSYNYTICGRELLITLKY